MTVAEKIELAIINHFLDDKGITLYQSRWRNEGLEWEINSGNTFICMLDCNIDTMGAMLLFLLESGFDLGMDHYGRSFSLTPEGLRYLVTFFGIKYPKG